MPKLVYSNSKGLVQEAGSGVDLGKARAQGLLRPVETVTAETYAPSLKDSGILILQNNSAGCDITLPKATAANAGWWCEILVKTTITVDDKLEIGSGTVKVTYCKALYLLHKQLAQQLLIRLFLRRITTDDHLYSAITRTQKVATQVLI